MSQKKMTWKRIIAIFSAIVLLGTSIPIENLRAESTGTVTFNETEVTLNETGSMYTPSITVTDAEGNLVNADAYSAVWTSNAEEIATVSETGVITAVGAGETTINVVCTYKDANEIEHTADGTMAVTVKIKPVLVLKQNDSILSSILYPERTNIRVAGVPTECSCRLTVNKVNEDGSNEEVFNEETTSFSGDLGTGTYLVEATTTEAGYYLAGDVSATFVVNPGNCTLQLDNGASEAYYSEEVTYKLNSGSQEGTFSLEESEDFELVKSDAEKTTAEFTVKFKKVGTSKLNFKFVPDDSNYAEATYEHEVVVKAITVEAYWDNKDLTRDYDGTLIFEAVKPKLRLTCEGDFLLPELDDTVENTYTFNLDEKDVGTYEEELTESLSLADDSYGYVLENPNPKVNITINAVVLDENDIYFNNFDAPEEKAYDGTATAVLSPEPKLNMTKIVEDTASLYYEAYYCDNNGNVVDVTNANHDITAKQVKLFNLGVIVGDETEVSSNYKFEISNADKLVKRGNYKITTNAPFIEFIGLEETEIGSFLGNMAVDGDKTIYWSNDGDGKNISKEGYTFLAFEPWKWNKFTSEITVRNSVQIIYAQNQTGAISQGIWVGHEGTAPNGQLYLKIGSGDDVQYATIDELVNTFDGITNIELAIGFNGSDKDSKIQRVEWYATDTAVDTNDETTWPESFSTKEVESVTETISELVLDSYEGDKEDTQVKKYYYARVYDYAGNVTYCESIPGALRDITEPIIGEEDILEASDYTFDNVNVYAKDSVNITVNVTEPETFSSGLNDVSVSLRKLDGEFKEIATYNIASSDEADLTFWGEEEGDAESLIRAFSNNVTPTADDIKNVSGDMELTGTLTGLKDGKYEVAIIAYDKAGGVAEEVCKQFIIDNAAPAIDIDETGLNNDSEGKKKDHTYTAGKLVVTVSDLTLVTEDTALLQGYEEAHWNTEVKADGTIVKTAVFCRNADAEKHENELTDAVYEFVVKAMDASGKSSTGSYGFTYDNSAPTYEVTFSKTNDNAIIDNEGTKLYYNDTLEAVFKINEDTNYDENHISITVKNAKGSVVAAWGPQEENITKEENPFITLEHETGSKEFKVIINKDDENHSTDDDGYVFLISGSDATGNELSEKEETYKNEVAKVRAFDTIMPDLTDVTYTVKESEDSSVSAPFNTVNGKDYVNADTTVTFALNEHNPYDSVYTLTSETPEDEKATVLTWTPVVDEEDKNVADQYVTEYVIPQLGVKGDAQNFTLTIMDKAGNKAVMSGTKRSENNTTFADGEFTDTFVVDSVDPIITYEYIDLNPNSVNVNGIDYFKEKAQVKVTIDEHNFDETCTVKPYVTAKNDANVVFTETEWEHNGDIHTKTFTFENDNEYEIKIDATDCALNDFVLSDDDSQITVNEDSENLGTSILKLAVDKTLPATGDTKKPVVVITPVTNPGTTTDAQALYNTDVVYEVAVYDPKVNNYASGIDGIEMTLTAEDGTTAATTITKEGTITAGTGMSVVLNEGVAGSLAQGEENKYVYYVTIAKDTFNSNGIKLTVKATDVSTNVTTKLDINEIAIDTTNPTVAIDYNNDDVHNEKYFNKGRTATITVTERNFSDDCLNFYVNGKRIALTFTLKKAGTGNRDDAVWVAKHKINKDGDYIIECDVKDRVGNEGTVAYAGEATKEFTVDKTMPKIAISFNNNNAQNGSYYSSARTATITVTEHNFKGVNVVKNESANNAGAAVAFPALSKWKSNGDVHTATLTFTEDGLYSFDLEYEDLATNKAKSPATSTFTIDNTDPEITFSDVTNGAAYPDEIVPKISFNDNNYLSHTVTLTRTGRENANEDVTSKFVKSSGVNVDGTGKATGSNTIPDIEHSKENDGIYTITVTVRDKAGRTKTESITYSVNRFGSVYVYSDDLLDLLNGYTKLEDIADKDLYITAYNADSLVADSTKLEITCDGALLTNQLSGANVENDRLESDGWYAYRFNLNNDDFAKEGSYVVTISDKDTAGNVQTNSDNPIEFSVDGTDPKLDSVIGLEEERYNTEEQVVKYTVSDAMGIAKIEIYIDGKVVETIEEFDNAATYEGQFIIPESSDRQSIKIVVTDKSGRVLDTSSEAFANDSERGYVFNSSVLVSTSLFDLWYDNKPVFWGSIAGVAAILGLFFFIILGKKKKEEDEEDEAA